MFSTSRNALACAPLILASASYATPQQQALAAPVISASHSPAGEPAIQSYLERETSTGFSGVALIARSGRPVVHAAYSKDPSLTTGSRLWIGSLTKPITATAILKLQEQGKLSVADPITKFFSDVPRDKRGITIHHLLTHTSGLPHEYRAEGIVDRDDAVKAILALPLKRAPGVDASYSNDGWSLLAAIVEIASGTSYEDYLTRTIFRPAEMKSSGFWPPAPGSPGFAKIANPPTAANSVPNWGYRGASGIYSTADDLFRFLSALREGRIITKASVDLAMGPRFPRRDKASIGYGWFMFERGGETTITHAGAEDGLQHFGWIYWLPASETSVILMSNSPEERAKETLSGLLKAVRSDSPRSPAPRATFHQRMAPRHAGR